MISGISENCEVFDMFGKNFVVINSPSNTFREKYLNNTQCVTFRNKIMVFFDLLPRPYVFDVDNGEWIVKKRWTSESIPGSAVELKYRDYLSFKNF